MTQSTHDPRPDVVMSTSAFANHPSAAVRGGLPAETRADLVTLGNAHFDQAWAGYETRHGVDHPRRFFDAEMAGAAGRFRYPVRHR